MIVLTVVILLILLLTILTIIWIKLKFSYWKRRKIPYFPPHFPLGNITLDNSKSSMGHVYWDFYKKAKARGLKYVGFYMTIEPVFVPIDPECIKQVLIKDFTSFHARGIYNNEKDQPLSANMFTVDGPKWRALRYKFSPAFTAMKIRYMYPLIVNCEKQLTDMIMSHAKINKPINVKNVMSRFTIDAITSCAFGVNSNSFTENPELFKNVIQCMDESTKLLRFIFLHAFPNVCKFFKVGLFSDKYLKYFVELITDAYEQRKKQLVYRTDFLQLMKEMQDQNIPELDVNLQEIQAQSFLFLMAGYETSSTAMTYLFLEFAEKQDIQERLRKEIIEVSEKYGEISYLALQEMKYLQCVIDETLRMYPPVPIINRRCTEDYHLSNGEILEKNTNIVIPVLAIQRDPEYYPNPEVFNPDRFTDENKAKIHSAVYLPFGEGPRNCIGSRFGLIEIKVAVSHLLKKFRFKINKNMDTTRRYSSHFVLKLAYDVLLDVEEI